jgi:hypothetical protein
MSIGTVATMMGLSFALRPLFSKFLKSFLTLFTMSRRFVRSEVPFLDGTVHVVENTRIL